MLAIILFFHWSMWDKLIFYVTWKIQNTENKKVITRSTYNIQSRSRIVLEVGWLQYSLKEHYKYSQIWLFMYIVSCIALSLDSEYKKPSSYKVFCQLCFNSTFSKFESLNSSGLFKDFVNDIQVGIRENEPKASKIS